MKGSNVEDIINISDKFRKISKDKCADFYKYIDLSILLGVYIGFIEYNTNVKYFIVEDEDEILVGKKSFENQGSVYQGELKLINDKLFLDTIDVDIIKYNL